MRPAKHMTQADRTKVNAKRPSGRSSGVGEGVSPAAPRTLPPPVPFYPPARFELLERPTDLTLWEVYKQLTEPPAKPVSLRRKHCPAPD